MSGTRLAVVAMALAAAVLVQGCASSAVRVKLPDGARLTSDRDANLSGLQYSTETTTAGVKKVSLSLPAYNGLSSPVITAKGQANASLVGAYGGAFAQNLDQFRQLGEAYFRTETALGAQQVQIARIQADLEAIKARLAVPAVTPAPVVATVPAVQPTPPVAGTDALAGVTVTWCGPDLSSAKVAGSCSFVEYTANDCVRLAYSDISAWPRPGDARCKTYAEPGCFGFFYVCVRRADGSWIGGKFDHIGPGPQTVKVLENIRGGYIKDANGQPVIPAAGDTVAFGVASYGLDERTPAALATWK